MTKTLFACAQRVLCMTLLMTLMVSSARATAPRDITVGVLLSKSGVMADIGKEGEHGIRLAERDVQEGLARAGLQVRFVYEDSRSSPEGAATAINKLLQSDQADVILGDLTSTATLAAAPLAQHARVPMLTPSSTSDKVTGIGDCIFRACYIDRVQGLAMARYARAHLHAQRAAMLVDLDVDHSRDVSAVFAKEFERQGGHIVRSLSFSGAHDISFVSQMTQLKRLAVDVIYAPVYYNRMAMLFRGLKSFAVPGTVLGTDAWDSPQLFELSRGATDGAYLTDPFSADNPAAHVQRFRHQFVAAYRVEPSSYAALAWDATHLLADALRRLPSTTEGRWADAIRAALRESADVEGVTGTMTFDAERNMAKPSVVLLRLSGGGQHFVDTLEGATP